MLISENIYLNFDLVIKFHDMDFGNTLVDQSPPLMLQQERDRSLLNSFWRQRCNLS